MRPATDFLPAAPAHGFRGDPEPTPLPRPRGLCAAISREAGARGGSIARKVGELLSWQVFDQDTIDYLIQNDDAREQLFSDLSPAALAWTDIHYRRIKIEQIETADADTERLIQLLLAVAARGDAVIVGRGAGYFLPVETTLHARVIAPLESRVAWFAQSTRLNRDDAATEIRARDLRRNEFLTSILGRNPADSTNYDIVVNSGRLGIEPAAQFIGWAVRTKQMFAELQESDDSTQLPNS